MTIRASTRSLRAMLLALTVIILSRLRRASAVFCRRRRNLGSARPRCDRADAEGLRQRYA